MVAFPRNAASVSRAQRFFGLAALSRATIARRRPAATRPLLRLMGSAAPGCYMSEFLRDCLASGIFQLAAY